jgi:hypothetical protein
MVQGAWSIYSGLTGHGGKLPTKNSLWQVVISWTSVVSPLNSMTWTGHDWKARSALAFWIVVTVRYKQTSSKHLEALHWGILRKRMTKTRRSYAHQSLAAPKPCFCLSRVPNNLCPDGKTVGSPPSHYRLCLPCSTKDVTSRGV